MNFTAVYNIFGKSQLLFHTTAISKRCANDVCVPPVDGTTWTLRPEARPCKYRSFEDRKPRHLNTKQR